MSIETYTFSSPLLRYSCPPRTPPASSWRTLDLAPEIDSDSKPGNTRIQVKATDGPGCTLTFGGWKASEAWVRGWLSPEESTWCCALDSSDFTCYTARGEWETVDLCGWAGLDPDREHTISIMSSPAGHSRVLIDSAYSNGKAPDEVKTTDLVTIATAAKPASVDLDTYYQTSSTSSTSQTSITSTSPGSSTTAPVPDPSGVAAEGPDPGPSDSPSTGSASSSTNSNALFLVFAVGILAIVIVCIVAVLCLRTEAKPGRVEVRNRRKQAAAVGERLLKRVDLERGRRHRSIRKESGTTKQRDSEGGDGTDSSTSTEDGNETTSSDEGKKGRRRRSRRAE